MYAKNPKLKDVFSFSIYFLRPPWFGLGDTWNE